MTICSIYPVFTLRNYTGSLNILNVLERLIPCVAYDGYLYLLWISWCLRVYCLANSCLYSVLSLCLSINLTSSRSPSAVIFVYRMFVSVCKYYDVQYIYISVKRIADRADKYLHRNGSIGLNSYDHYFIPQTTNPIK